MVFLAVVFLATDLFAAVLFAVIARPLTSEETAARALSDTAALAEVLRSLTVQARQKKLDRTVFDAARELARAVLPKAPALTQRPQRCTETACGCRPLDAGPAGGPSAKSDKEAMPEASSVDLAALLRQRARKEGTWLTSKS